MTNAGRYEVGTSDGNWRTAVQAVAFLLHRTPPLVLEILFYLALIGAGLALNCSIMDTTITR